MIQQAHQAVHQVGHGLVAGRHLLVDDVGQVAQGADGVEDDLAARVEEVLGEGADAALGDDGLLDVQARGEHVLVERVGSWKKKAKKINKDRTFFVKEKAINTYGPALASL